MTNEKYFKDVGIGQKFYRWYGSKRLVFKKTTSSEAFCAETGKTEIFEAMCRVEICS